MVKYLSCPGGEVVNASVCKTDTRGFDSRPGLKNKPSRKGGFIFVAGVEKVACDYDGGIIMTT